MKNYFSKGNLVRGMPVNWVGLLVDEILAEIY